jgi:hypothetical protein
MDAMRSSFGTARGKGIQNSNGKWQMANGEPFEICYLPFAI